MTDQPEEHIVAIRSLQIDVSDDQRHLEQLPVDHGA